MPNRMVREGFLDSQAVHNLTDPAECFYHRLLIAADDAGRMDGRLEVLRARLFPLDSSRRSSDVEKQLRECVSEGLVIPYEWDGKPYVQVTKFQRTSPALVSKFPWTDGGFGITWVKCDTRDGKKDFVSSSLPQGFGIPSASLPEGIGMGSGPPWLESTETETESETLSTASTEVAAVTSPGSGLRFPTIGRGVPEWEAPLRLLQQTEETFPMVDVRAEWRRASLWLEANPLKRKTAVGMARFLTGWITRAVNRSDFAPRNGTRPSGPLKPMLTPEQNAELRKRAGFGLDHPAPKGGA